MADIKKKIVVTTVSGFYVDIVNGEAIQSEMDVTIEGKVDSKKAKKAIEKMNKDHENRNVIVTGTHYETFVYTMTINDFIAHAQKEKISEVE